jgi:hypothetical protein
MTKASESPLLRAFRGPGPSLCLLAALAGGGFALGAKLMLVHRYGTDVPYWDEWDAVGGDLLVPLADHNLHAADFLLPHNEHRIVFTRLISYALALWNRQWDPLLEVTANALIHAGFCAALILFAGRLVTGARFAAVAAVTVMLFTGSFDWENTLHGLQSQFYFLEWGALGMLLLSAPAAPLSLRWWAGLLCGIASLGAMASGFLAASAILAVMALRAAVEGRWSRRDTIAGALLAGLCILGRLSVTRVPGHDELMAHSAADWFKGLVSMLSWPVSGFPAAFLVIQAPIGVFIAERFRSRRLSGAESVMVGMAFWSGLQVAVISYGRVNLGLDNSRYTDLFAVGLFANALALFVIVERARGRMLLRCAAAAWVVLVALGIREQNHEAQVRALDDYPASRSAERRHIRAFLADGKLGDLASAPLSELPYPRVETLGQFLSAPGIASMLPVGIRPAIGLAADADSGGFSEAGPEGLPPGAESRVWIARKGPAKFVSRALEAAKLPYLHMEYCGSPELGSAVIHLESANGDEFPSGIFPLAGQWQTVDLSITHGFPTRLVVEIPPGNHWFAFTEPVELGGGSWANRWVLRRSALIEFLSGAVLAGALVAITVLGGKRRDP